MDALLRPGRGPAPLGPTVAAVLVGGAVYGAAMGSFAGRGSQAALSAAKVPLLLLLTTALALPSFFVLNTLLGLRRDWPAAVRAVVGAQGAVAVVLAALAPYPLVWYASAAGYHAATAFNGGMFLLAALAAQVALRRAYAPLAAADRRHRVAVAAWVVVYAFVAVQLAWVLRPFVGDPARPVTLFRPGALGGNAYVAVADVVREAVTR